MGNQTEKQKNIQSITNHVTIQNCGLECSLPGDSFHWCSRVQSHFQRSSSHTRGRQSKCHDGRNRQNKHVQRRHDAIKRLFDRTVKGRLQKAGNDCDDREPHQKSDARKNAADTEMTAHVRVCKRHLYCLINRPWGNPVCPRAPQSDPVSEGRFGSPLDMVYLLDSKDAVWCV